MTGFDCLNNFLQEESGDDRDDSRKEQKSDDQHDRCKGNTPQDASDARKCLYQPAEAPEFFPVNGSDRPPHNDPQQHEDPQ